MATLFDTLNKTENEPKVLIKEGSVQVLDADIKTKILKKKLSPSLIESVLSSPGDWLMNTYIMPLCIDGYIPHLERGKWFHTTMEKFYLLPPEKRTEGYLKEVANTVSANDYRHLLGDKDNLEWYRSAINQYMKHWLASAKDEKIARLIVNNRSKIGLEVFVEDKIGKTQRTTLGFIDKVVETDKGLVVFDYKTGAHIHNFNPGKAVSESNPFDYWRQQTIYAILLERLGYQVASAHLIFPCAEEPQVIDVDCHRKDVREMVFIDCVKADSILSECIQNDFTFPFCKGKFNGWASMLCGIGSARFPQVGYDTLEGLIQRS